MTGSQAPSRQALAQEYLRAHPAEAAALLENQPVDEVLGVLRTAAVPVAAAVVERLTPDVAARLLAAADQVTVARLLSVMDPTRAAAVLASLDTETRDELLAALDERLASDLRTQMSYPTDSAGQFMDLRIPVFRPQATVGDALARLREMSPESVLNVYLVDQEGRFAGIVPLQQLLLATPDDRLGGLAQAAEISVLAMASREEVVEALTRHRLTSLPVVDFEGTLLGVIRYAALVAVTEEEASADMQTLVGAGKEERALSPLFFAVRKRLPWLQINLVTAFLAAAVVGLFEGTIAQFTALAVLLPVVAGQSGNTGAQALAVTLRGLALREIRLRHWPRIALKEVSTGTLNGCAVALVTVIGVFVWSQSWGLCLVIGLAMAVSMMIAGLAGAGVPMVLTALRQDPAQSSSILLTTITDITGFLSFLGLATLLSGLL